MELTKSNKIAIICAFGAVIFTVVLNIGIREWYSPYVRYEEGGWYYSKNIAITSLKLKNYGHADAENIVINVNFPLGLTEVSTDDPSIELELLSGGLNNLQATGKIVRLVPGQQIYIYFGIDSKGYPFKDLNSNFLSQITYKGGTGRTGEPFFRMILFVIMGCLIGVSIGVASSRLTKKTLSRSPLYGELVHLNTVRHMSEAVNVAVQRNLPRNDLRNALEEHFQSLSTEASTTLTELAMTLYESISPAAEATQSSD